MITRKEYMKDSINLYHDYYSQFVTNQTIQFVADNIGIDKLKKSKDPHFNDIVPIPKYGSWLWDCSPIDLDLARKLGEVGAAALPAKATKTCVGKAAARILLKEFKDG